MVDVLNAQARIALELGDARMNVHLLTEQVQHLTALVADRDKTIEMLTAKIEAQMTSVSSE